MIKTPEWVPDRVIDALLVRDETEAFLASELSADDSDPRVLYWVDPMHPDFKSDAGIGPDCSMQLEPVYAETTAFQSTVVPK